MIIKWRHPFTCIIAGPSCSGKTEFVLKFLRNLQSLVDGKIDKIIWCCSFGSMPNTNGISNIQFLWNLPKSFANPDMSPILYIIDDLMADSFNDNRVSELFTKDSHHSNISVILISQNIFHQSRFSRTISLNAKYIVCFRNIRDRSQFRHLAAQVYPENSAALSDVYREVTAKPFSYLLLDFAQETDDCLRFRTNIFPGENNEIFVPPNLLRSINHLQL